jgi:PAS domain S-box-containing protein
MTSLEPPEPAGGDALRARVWRLAADTELAEDQLVQRFLEMVGPALGMARAGLHRLEQDELVCALEWHREGLPAARGARVPFRAFAHLFGKPVAEFDPLELLLQTPADLQPQVRQALDNIRVLGVASALGVPFTVSGRLEGALTFHQQVAMPAGWSAPLRPIVAELAQIVAVAIARRRAEAALRASEASFRALFELAADAMFIVAKDGEILAVNAAACRHLGYTRDELLRMRIEDFSTPPRDDPRLQTLAALPGVVLESVHRRRDGSELRVEVSFAAVEFRGQRATCCIARDVTGRHRAEQALRESAQRFRELAELLPQAIFETDTRGKFTYMNRHGIELLGLTAADLAAGVTMYDVVPPQYHHEVAGNFAEAIEGRRPRGVGREQHVHSRDGHQLEVVIHSNLILRDGAPAGLRGVAIDVTAQKRAEAERQRLEAKMLQSQKLESLGLLAGGLAHDFNNLLVGILGNAELAITDLARSPQAVRRLERIKRGAQRASELANQMLAYSGKGQTIVERIDLSAAVAELSGLVESGVTRKGRLHFELARDLPPIEADATQVRQVVMNLILNAAEAIGDAPGAIVLRTGVTDATPEALADAWGAEAVAPGRYVFVEVTDTGCGMDEATKPRIFDPFFTTKFTGRGLGLAAVLGIVRQHRGAITVESAPGSGTTFRVLLPAAPSATVVVAPPPRPGEWRGSGTVLVVDDEEEVREVAGDMLRALGFGVRTAANGREALAAMERHGTEVVAVLLDLTMPVMNGAETFPRLRELAPELPIVLASGYGEHDITARLTPTGRAAIVQKPFALETLRRKLRAAMGQE